MAKNKNKNKNNGGSMHGVSHERFAFSTPSFQENGSTSKKAR